MTLRGLIYKMNIANTGMLEKMADFNDIADYDVIIADGISDKKLSNYFSSDKFKRDVINASTKIDDIIAKFSYINLERKNFFLYVMGKNSSLKIEIEPLVH